MNDSHHKGEPVNRVDIEVGDQKAQIAKLAKVADSSATESAPRSEMMKRIASYAPDVAEIALASFINPVSGLGVAFKVIAERSKAQSNALAVQRQATEKYEEKVRFVEQSTGDRFHQLSQDPHGLAGYLLERVQLLLQDAARLNDEVLLGDVARFASDAMPQLLASMPDAPPSLVSLAKIRTDLELVQLRVWWADVHNAAKREVAAAEAIQAAKQLQEEAKRQKALQDRVLAILIIYVLVLIATLIFGGQVFTGTTVVPILGVPISVVLWSSVGSLGNMLYRYYKQPATQDIRQELRWVWTRPLVGIVMGLATYLVVVSALAAIGAATPQATSPQLRPELLWLLALVGGFSDKIFESVIDRVGLMAEPAMSPKARLDEGAPLRKLAEITASETKLESARVAPEPKPTAGFVISGNSNPPSKTEMPASIIGDESVTSLIMIEANDNSGAKGGPNV